MSRIEWDDTGDRYNGWDRIRDERRAEALRRRDCPQCGAPWIESSKDNWTRAHNGGCRYLEIPGSPA